MKITIEGEHNRIEIEEKGVEVIDEVMEMVKKALLAFGFHEESIKHGFEGMCEE